MFVHGSVVPEGQKERYTTSIMRHYSVLLFMVVCGGSLFPGTSSAQSAQFTIGMQVIGADMTPPSVPMNISNTVIANVPQVDVSWDASTDALSGVAYYNIYRDLVLYASTSLTTYSDLGVVVDTSYSYRISAVDNGSNESAQSVATVANVTAPSGGGGDTTAPSIPLNLVAVVDGHSPSVALTWSASTDDQSGVMHYRIYRNGSFINTSVVTDYTDFNVATGTTYTYRVSAVDGSGNQSNQSNEAEAVIPSGQSQDTTPPSIPLNLSIAINGDAPSTTLSWNPSSDAESGVSYYRIYRNTTLYATTTAIQLLDPGVVRGNTYTYRVSAVDGAGNASAQSAEVIATIPQPDTTPPSVPQNVSATPASTPSVALTWNAATDAESGVVLYRIFRNEIALANTPGLSYVDMGVTPGLSYNYRVAAVDGAGNMSAPSDPASATIPLPPEDPESSEPEDPVAPNEPGDSSSPSSPGSPHEPPGPSDPSTSPNPDPSDPIPPDESPRPLAPRDLVPSIAKETRDKATQLVTDARDQARRSIERVSEDPGRTRVITVGTAVTGLLIPAIEFGIVPLASGSSFWYALLLRVRDIGQFIAWLFSWLGIRKRRRPWGTVYDSVTKQPLDPAYVELLDATTGESITSAITDLDGRYGFSPEPGRYVLKAAKTNYVFPSTRLVGSSEDIIYNHLYFGDKLTITGDDSTLIAHDIPMDPTTFDWNEFEKRRLGVMKFYSRFGLVLHSITQALFYIGFAFAVFVLYLSPSPVNIVVVVVYVIIMLLRKLFMKPLNKGRVIDEETGAPVAYASVEVYLPVQPERPIKKVPTDELGRYYCLVQPNEYYVIIKEQLRDGSFRPLYQSETFTSKKGVIDKRFVI